MLALALLTIGEAGAFPFQETGGLGCRTHIQPDERCAPVEAVQIHPGTGAAIPPHR